MTDSLHTTAPTFVQDDEEISLLDLLQVVVENLRLLFFGPLVLGIVALGISYLLTPVFTATTRILPPQQQQSSAAMMMQSLGALGGLAGAATGLKNPNDQFVALLKSESIANALIARFSLQQKYQQDFKFETRATLEKNTKVSTGKDGLITIEVDDSDPIAAAEIANAYVSEFSLLLSRLAITEAQQRRLFFEGQLTQTKEKLASAEQALRASGMNRSAVKSSPEASIKALAEFQARIVGQEVKLASMRGYLTESSPDFRQAKTELEALRSQMARVEAAQPIAFSPGADADYITRLREVKYFETLLEMFGRQFEIAKTDEAREGSTIQVVDVAQPPERKSRPKRAIIAIVVTLGTGVMLLIFVFARHAWRSSIQRPEGVEKHSNLQRAWTKALRRV